MKLFVGLGNPGARHARNRHNVGVLAVDRIAERGRFGAWRKRFEGFTAEGEVGGERVMLLKPETYMNESGRSVGAAARFLKIGEDDVFVFHDELDLAPGRLKAKTGGGNAGHNGLRSISAHLGNEYARVRIGIGHPGVKDAVQHYVLHDFAKADAEWLEPMLDAIAAAAPRLAAGDLARFTADVGRALEPDEPASKTPLAPGRGPVDRASPAARMPHPAGERVAKRQSALARNLTKWLAARGKSED